MFEEPTFQKPMTSEEIGYMGQQSYRLDLKLPLYYLNLVLVTKFHLIELSMLGLVIIAVIKKEILIIRTNSTRNLSKFCSYLDKEL